MMIAYLDMRTLFFVSGIISLIFFVIMLYVYMTRKIYPGFWEWVVSYSLLFTASTLISLRGIIPDFLSIVMANLFIAAGLILWEYGLIAFTGGKQRMGWHIFILVFLTTTSIYFTYSSPDVNIRILIISGLTTAYCIRCLSVIHKRIPLILPKSNLLLIVAFYGLALWSTFRFFFTLFLEQEISDLMTTGIIHGLMIIVSFSSTILTGMGYIAITLQRVENDFLVAQNEIKTLKGFLPICSSCKKIRDDKGYWNQIESYIREHSEAEFTHGICPECFKKLYPDFVD